MDQGVPRGHRARQDEPDLASSSAEGGEAVKLKALIAKLEKARASYVRKHGCEPSVWSWDEDDGLFLCANVQKFESGVTQAEKPYLTAKVEHP